MTLAGLPREIFSQLSLVMLGESTEILGRLFDSPDFSKFNALHVDHLLNSLF